jgi:hypothetical protein
LQLHEISLRTQSFGSTNCCRLINDETRCKIDVMLIVVIFLLSLIDLVRTHHSEINIDLSDAEISFSKVEVLDQKIKPFEHAMKTKCFGSKALTDLENDNWHNYQTVWRKTTTQSRYASFSINF